MCGPPLELMVLYIKYHELGRIPWPNRCSSVGSREVDQAPLQSWSNKGACLQSLPNPHPPPPSSSAVCRKGGGRREGELSKGWGLVGLLSVQQNRRKHSWYPTNPQNITGSMTTGSNKGSLWLCGSLWFCGKIFEPLCHHTSDNYSIFGQKIQGRT